MDVLEFNEGINYFFDKCFFINDNLIIDKKVEFIGDNSSIEGCIFVQSNATFFNIKFIKSTIYIYNGSTVEFRNCSFRNINNPIIILDEDSECHLLMISCEIIAQDIAILANNNYIDLFLDNIFKFCKIAIKINEFKLLGKVRNNFLISCKNSLLIEIFSINYKLEKAINTLRQLSNENNKFIIVVIQYCNENNIYTNKSKYQNTNVCVYKNVYIEIKYVVVKDNKELQLAIESSNNGWIILMKQNNYYGDIYINKSIKLIGEKNVIIQPNNRNKNYAGIIIEGESIEIENIKIINNEALCFKDGIKFTNIGVKRCIIKGVIIQNVKRRGIAIWGRKTCSTSIINSEINEIKNTAVFLWRKVEVLNSKMSDINISFKSLFQNKIVIDGCSFKNVNTLLELEDFDAENININKNKYNEVKEFIKYVEE